MTTFNNIDDLLRILDENPQLLDAVRARVLTRELLALPETVARLTERVDQIAVRMDQIAVRMDQLTERVDQLAERMDQLTERVDQLAERMDQLAARMDQLTERMDQLTVRMDQLTERMDQLAHRMDQLTERMDQLAHRMDQLTERMDQLTVRMDQLAHRMDQLTERMDQLAHRMDQLAEGQEIIKNDIGAMRTQMGDIRGRIVYDITRDEAPLLANDLGFYYVATLSSRDLMNLTQDIDTGDIEPNDLKSFHRADAVIQATNPDAETVYIAVEASFTVNGRDTSRARRNARYLTRFTGIPAIPAVAGVVIDHHIRDALASEQLFWYEIPLGDLQPE
jgi:predicted nuclease with TOPRIM domain